MSLAIPRPSRLAELRPVSALFAPVSRPEHLQAILDGDPGLTRRLLRDLNASAIDPPLRVTSVIGAATRPGVRTVHRQALLLALAALAGDRRESFAPALTRAKACDLVARARGELSAVDAYFVAGLLSAAEPLVGAPPVALVAVLPLEDDVAAALLWPDTPLGAVVAAVADYADGRSSPLSGLVPDPTVLPRLYERAGTFGAEATHELLSI